MLSKLIPRPQMLQKAATFMGASATRGVYTDETRPYVFINEHTKVIVQGMTGKHVSRIWLSACRGLPVHHTIPMRYFHSI